MAATTIFVFFFLNSGFLGSLNKNFFQLRSCFRLYYNHDDIHLGTKHNRSEHLQRKLEFVSVFGGLLQFGLELRYERISKSKNNTKCQHGAAFQETPRGTLYSPRLSRRHPFWLRRRGGLFGGVGLRRRFELRFLLVRRPR